LPAEGLLEDVLQLGRYAELLMRLADGRIIAIIRPASDSP